MHDGPNFGTRLWLIYPLAAALFVIGVKCHIIGAYGSPTPYWDQWEAEASLYAKYLGGTLQPSDLIAPFHQHRILMTRLWSLLLLELEGYWDPILQMLANGTLLGALVALIVTLFRPLLTWSAWLALTLLAMAMFGSPLSWRNPLEGFDSAWYFVLLFSIGGLAAIVRVKAFTASWWLAVILLTASYFTMASGALALAAAAVVVALQTAFGSRIGGREAWGLASLAAVAAGALFLIPSPDSAAALQAHSIEQFVRAFLKIASWPVALNRFDSAGMALCAVAVQAPVVLTGIVVLRRRPVLSDPHWRLVALIGLAALYVTATAYARAAQPLGARYIDVYIFVLLLNCACMFVLFESQSLSSRRLFAGAVGVWLFFVLAGSSGKLLGESAAGLLYKQTSGRAHTENLRAFLASLDVASLTGKPPGDIPYDPRRLAAIVADPAVRAILPPQLIGETARKRQNGLAQLAGHAVEILKNYLLRWGVVVASVGAALFLLGLAFGIGRPTPAPAPR
jgi:hypothetical protein